MAVECAKMSRGKMLRITKLNECGAVVEGAGSSLVASAFVSGTFTPNYQEVQEISLADANGGICIEDRSPVALRWVDVSLVICTLDPTMINLITERSDSHELIRTRSGTGNAVHRLDSDRKSRNGAGVAKWLPDGDLEACFPD
jgi:hypothetical protein